MSAATKLYEFVRHAALLPKVLGVTVPDIVSIWFTGTAPSFLSDELRFPGRCASRGSLLYAGLRDMRKPKNGIGNLLHRLTQTLDVALDVAAGDIVSILVIGESLQSIIRNIKTLADS